uniref:Uncharacterized protein n=1 Tax=Anopheles farauti TaxID=69004 RepID=A0A182Q4S7_9DIPT
MTAHATATNTGATYSSSSGCSAHDAHTTRDTTLARKSNAVHNARPGRARAGRAEQMVMHRGVRQRVLWMLRHRRANECCRRRCSRRGAERISVPAPVVVIAVVPANDPVPAFPGAFRSGRRCTCGVFLLPAVEILASDDLAGDEDDGGDDDDDDGLLAALICCCCADDEEEVPLTGSWSKLSKRSSSPLRWNVRRIPGRWQSSRCDWSSVPTCGEGCRASTLMPLSERCSSTSASSSEEPSSSPPPLPRRNESSSTVTRFRRIPIGGRGGCGDRSAATLDATVGIARLEREEADFMTGDPLRNRKPSSAITGEEGDARNRFDGDCFLGGARGATSFTGGSGSDGVAICLALAAARRSEAALPKQTFHHCLVMAVPLPPPPLAVATAPELPPVAFVAPNRTDDFAEPLSPAVILLEYFPTRILRSQQITFQAQPYTKKTHHQHRLKASSRCSASSQFQQNGLSKPTQATAACADGYVSSADFGAWSNMRVVPVRGRADNMPECTTTTTTTLFPIRIADLSPQRTSQNRTN